MNRTAIYARPPVQTKTVFEVTQRPARAVAAAPVHIGDIIVANVLGTGSNVAATNNIGRKP